MPVPQPYFPYFNMNSNTNSVNQLDAVMRAVIQAKIQAIMPISRQKNNAEKQCKKIPRLAREKVQGCQSSEASP